MKTATAKKLVKDAGLTFSTQDERLFSRLYDGNFWFHGESRLFPSRARFNLIGSNLGDKINQLATYLNSLGYETKTSSDCVEITNLNEDGGLQ
jgi:hypothetical protein